MVVLKPHHWTVWGPVQPDDDLGVYIATLAPDVSWADDLPTPTPAEIRERVSGFTAEQRAAAELDAVRAERDLSPDRGE